MDNSRHRISIGEVFIEDENRICLEVRTMKKDLNKLTFCDLQKEIERIAKKKDSATTKKVGVWEVGKNYVLRTVTMIDVGRLVAVTDQELVLEDACWIADTGRWNEFLKDGTYLDSEPFPEGRVVVGRNALIDAVLWNHALIRSVK